MWTKNKISKGIKTEKDPLNYINWRNKTPQCQKKPNKQAKKKTFWNVTLLSPWKSWYNNNDDDAADDFEREGEECEKHAHKT